MDDYRPVNRSSAHRQRSGMSAPVRQPETVVPVRRKTITFNLHVPKFKKLGRASLAVIATYGELFAAVLKKGRVRATLFAIIVVLVVADVVPLFQSRLASHTYEMGNSEAVLSKKDSILASKLKYNQKTMSFDFNIGYSPINATTDNASGGPVITAVAYKDPAKGLKVTDPLNNVDFTIKPKFALLPGEQDGNRIKYPLSDGTGWLVYTMQATAVKEDVVLRSANGDTMKLDYEMDLDAQGLEAHLEKDGSVGVYGSSSPVTGSVSTGNNKDAALLKKARQYAKKDKYLFSLPAPTVYARGHIKSSAKTHFELKDNIVTSITTGLTKASFPLTVDPAVTVIGSSDLFRDTNPESNVDLDATTGNIGRGKVTGGVVIRNWTTNPTNNLSTARWLAGATVYDDYAYVAGGAGSGSTTNLSSVEYAAMSKADSTISAWASTTALPAALSRFQLIAYNGYLYAIGGSTTSTTCATVSSAIYYNRIQTNGQLSASWSTNSVTLPAGVCGMGAAIYNNKLYVVGGRTSNLTTTGVNTAYYAGVNPDGSIGSFTTDNSTLPAARYDVDLKIYNGYMYIVAGTLAGNLTNTVLKAAIASDGSIYGGAGSASWVSATNLQTARSNLGATLATVNDGYMYVQGGCSAMSAANQFCTAMASDIEVAQINADGTLGNWSNIATSVASYTQVGGSLLFWRGTIYLFAGCTNVNTGIIGQCTTTTATQQYDTIAPPGQLGPKKSTTDMPNINGTSSGVYEHGVAIVNGYMYLIGGCITVGGTNACGTGTADTSPWAYYAPITASDGSVGAWTKDTTTANKLNGATGLAGFGLAVYQNYIYVVGGYKYVAGSSGAVNNVQFATVPAAGGAFSAGWTSAGVTLANASYNLSAQIYKGYLMTFGGCTNTSGGYGCSTYYQTVQTGLINASTGAISGWTTTTSLPTAYGNAALGGTVYNGYVYLAGGASTTDGGQTSAILYANISATGTISSWSTTTGIMTTNGTNALTLRRTDAYAMNGYLYVIGGHDGTSNITYGTVQIGKINLNTGNIDSNLAPSITTITPRWDERVAFANGRIYVTGGCTTGNPPATCSSITPSAPSYNNEYVELYNAGNKGTSTWSYASHTPPADLGGSTAYVTGAATVAYRGYIYQAGGCNTYTVSSSTCNVYTNNVYYAPLNPDGSIGTWASGGTLGVSLTDSCLVGVGGYLYSIGGKSSGGTDIATVYYSQIGANGLPGTWNTTTALGTALSSLKCATFNNFIYTSGGVSGGTAKNLVYYSPSMSSGGTISSWTSTTAFTTARYNHQMVIAGGYMYIIGGYSGSAYLYDVQYAQLNPTNGTISGSWASSGDMPIAAQQQSAFAANGYIYIYGGRTAAATCSQNTWVASINSTGILSSWSQAFNNFSTARFGAGSAYYNGTYYMLGGDDCSNTIITNSIAYGGEQSQAMKTVFSKYADLNGDGDPEKLVIYLTNAVNNSVDIEEWQMIYQSSREATNSWGQTTTVLPLLNQNAYDVYSYDSGGIDQIVARWFYLQFSIDMYQSYSFQDTNQPTIYQYGLHYAPPPSKRLIHGQDFRDQTHQGLDLKL